MTIENNLASIAKSLELIASALTAKTANPTPVVAPAQTVTSAPMVIVDPVPVVIPAAVMPPTPVFTEAVPVATPAPAPVVSTGPATFASKQAMTDFVISSYKALGPEKGAKIQQVLESLGFKNINDVPEAQWGALKAGIEALK